MDYSDKYLSYSWHQSHDQATVLLMVPYDTKEDDVEVLFKSQFVVAGVRGHSPIVKGRLYSSIDTANSTWQLEPRIHTRERTLSNTTSTTASTNSSSFALISDPEITSSFAASLEARSAQVSESDDNSNSAMHSPAWSSPSLLSLDVNQLPYTSRSRYNSNAASSSSAPVSPGHPIASISSSYSSLDSAQSQSCRLLTLHLEKEQPTIWPSLVSGPLPEEILPCPRHPAVYKTSHQLEHHYNVDATTLTLMGIEHHDIRNKKQEAFEYFIRAWHSQRVPSSAIRLVSNYVPLQTDLDNLALSAHATQGLPYYVQCLGGLPGVADLYLQAGLLYLEGRASHLLYSPSASLSSLRIPEHSSSSSPSSPTLLTGGGGGGGTQAWQRDQKMARLFFERARGLQPTLDIPTLPLPHTNNNNNNNNNHYSSTELEIPTLDMSSFFGMGGGGGGNNNNNILLLGDEDEDQTVLAPRPPPSTSSSSPVPRRRRKTTTTTTTTTNTKNPPTPFKNNRIPRRSIKVDHDDPDSLIVQKGDDLERERDGGDGDETWLLYVPGLIGVGTAMLVVGVVGALSFSWGRRNQGS